MPPLAEIGKHNEYLLFLDSQTPEPEKVPGFRLIRPTTSEGQSASASATGRRSLLDLWRMGRAVARENLDVMFFPSVYSYFPVPSRVPEIVALHDTIAERHGRVVFPNRRTRLFWNLKVTVARRKARGLITVSEWSRQSLSDWFGIPSGQIFVTPEAPAADFRPLKDPKPLRRLLETKGLSALDPYFIYVGGFNPHKNLSRAIRAFSQLPRTGLSTQPRLFLVGDPTGDLFHSQVRTLQEEISARGLTQQVTFLGFVPDDELRLLYAGAMAVLLPSLEEGFGLPAIEAAACGTPCIATRNSPLPDLLEGGGIFIDPHETLEIKTALETVIDNGSLRNQMAGVALERSSALSWEATARATLGALEAVARC